MPTYLFDNVGPVKEIIEAEGKFGPNQMYQATAIFEMINVFGGIEWALFMSPDTKRNVKAMSSNPFVSEWDAVWCINPDDRHIIELGSLSIVTVSGQTALAILRAKFGDNEQTRTYTIEAERTDGYSYWSNHFATPTGFDRDKLVDDYEAWLSAQEGG